MAECCKNDMEVEDKIVFELIQYVDEIINQENFTFEQACSKATKDHTEGDIRFRKYLKNEDVNNIMEDLLTEEEIDQLLDHLPPDPDSGFLLFLISHFLREQVKLLSLQVRINCDQLVECCSKPLKQMKPL